MADNCKMVVFSDKAYNAIIRETFEWDPVETGGILLGHILDNGRWIVLEVLPPGYSEGREGDNVHHEMGYFEYNQRFVNYLANSVATQYKIPLDLLGLWHRHPGSMDHFSSTDDGTNASFASQNPNGAISGLVNIDPQFRMTMYYIGHNDVVGRTPRYQKVDVEVGSDLIPEEYFEMKFYGGVNDDLHPFSPNRTNTRSGNIVRNESESSNVVVSDHSDPRPFVVEPSETQGLEIIFHDENGPDRHDTTDLRQQIDEVWDQLKKNKMIFYLFVFFLVVVFGFSVKSCHKDVDRFFKTKPVSETKSKSEPVVNNDTVTISEKSGSTPQNKRECSPSKKTNQDQPLNETTN